MYRFYKHDGKWRFIKKGSEIAQLVGLQAIEQLLGVTGRRETHVKVEQPDNRAFFVIVKNGFIEKVEYLYEENAYYDVENERYPYITTKREEQNEFIIKDWT